MIRKAADDRSALVCIACEDFPQPAAGSTRQRCADSGREVWVSPASARAVGPEAIILCCQCSGARLARQATLPETIAPTPEQLQEMADYYAAHPEGPPETPPRQEGPS